MTGSHQIAPKLNNKGITESSTAKTTGASKCVIVRVSGMIAHGGDDVGS